MVEGQHNRRPDVVLFVNGLPLAVIELKNPADENATIWSAFHQLQTYQAADPRALRLQRGCWSSPTASRPASAPSPRARSGSSPGAPSTGERMPPPRMPELQVMLEGVFEQRRFLDLMRYFIVFEDDGGGKLDQEDGRLPPVPRRQRGRGGDPARGPGRAEGRGEETPGRYEAGAQPGGDPGDRRVGVVWHTQGSGKSLTMAFYAGRIILHPAMAEPHPGGPHRPQRPGRPALRHLLPLPGPAAPAAGAGRRTARDLRRETAAWHAGGVVFTTIQKFFPEERGDRHPLLSDRRKSWSSPTRPTAASTTSSTASPGTCATRCPTPPSSASPARPSS